MTPHLPPDERPAANAGRKVAARNRALLIAAARDVYAESGLNAPLSAIAKRAGVGQAVLYRHFPDRAAVTNAVLEQNVQQVEQAAATEGTSFADVLGVVTWHLTESAAFLDLVRADVVTGRSALLEHAVYLSERVESALRRKLPDGHPLMESDDLMLACAMVSGAVTGPTRDERERRALAAWRLLAVEVGPVRPYGE